MLTLKWKIDKFTEILGREEIGYRDSFNEEMQSNYIGAIFY